MIQEIKDKWVHDLLSGEIAQGRFALHSFRDNVDLMCPWGVYLNILHARGVVMRRLDIENNRFKYRHADDAGGLWVAVYPTDRMLDAGGINWDDGDTGHIVSKLAGLNDNGSNFAYIASEIMEHL